jgi:hypothetical protein
MPGAKNGVMEGIVSAISPPLDVMEPRQSPLPPDDSAAAGQPKPLLHLETPYAVVWKVLAEAKRRRLSKRDPSKTEIVLMRDPDDPRREFSRTLRESKAFKKLRAVGIDWRTLHNVCAQFHAVVVLEARERQNRKTEVCKLRRARKYSERVKTLTEPFLGRTLPFRIGIEIDHVREEIERRMTETKRGPGKPRQLPLNFFYLTCAALCRLAPSANGRRRQFYNEFSELAELVFPIRKALCADTRASSYKRAHKYAERWAKKRSRLLMVQPDGSATVVGHI